MNNIFDIKNGLILFDNNILDIIADVDDILWFNAKNVCIILGYNNTKKAIRNHVDDNDRKYFMFIKTKYKISKYKNFQPHSIYINESGLYSLLFKSRLEIGKKFKNWITSEVIPNIRKYGKYIMSEKYNKKLKKLNNEIENLKRENENIKNNLKMEKYPIGGIIYVMKTNKDGIYKIGISNCLNSRCKTYNTSIVDNVNIVYYKKIDCPIQFELCVKSLLYKYRYRNNREFYFCDLTKIKNAIKNCMETINCYNSENNVTTLLNKTNEKLKNKQSKYKNKINLINK